MLSIDLSEFELPVSSAPVSVSDIATLLRECKEVLEQELELADEDPEPPAPSAVPVPVNLSRKVLLPENQQVDVQSVLLLNRLYSIESKYLEGLQDLFLSSIFRNEILTQASRDGDSDHSKKDYATRHSGGAAINVHAFQFLRGHALSSVDALTTRHSLTSTTVPRTTLGQPVCGAHAMILEEFAVAHWTPNVLERTVLRRALRNRPDAIDAFCIARYKLHGPEVRFKRTLKAMTKTRLDAATVRKRNKSQDRVVLFGKVSLMVSRSSRMNG